MNSGDTAKQWHIASNGKAYGPFTLDQLSVLARQGRVKGNLLIRAVGAGDWIPIAADPILACLVASNVVRDTAPRTVDIAVHEKEQSAQGTRRYFVRRGVKVVGPVTASQLRRYAADGRLVPSDEVWIEGGKPRRASLLKGLHFQDPVTDTPSTSGHTSRASCVTAGNAIEQSRVAASLTVQQAPVFTPQAEPVTFRAYCWRGTSKFNATMGHLIGACDVSLNVNGRSLEVRRTSFFARSLTLSRPKPLSLPINSMSYFPTQDNGSIVLAGELSIFGNRDYLMISHHDFTKVLAAFPNSPLQAEAQDTLEAAEFNHALSTSSPGTPATWIIAGLVCAVFAIGCLWSGQLQPDSEVWKQFGCSLPPLLSGQWYRIVTSAFVHADFKDLGVVIFALFQIGRFGERLLGTRSYLIVFVVSIVGSNWSASAWHRSESLVFFSLNGAISGLVGLLLAAAILGVVPASIRKRLFLTSAFFVLVSAWTSFKSSMTHETPFDLAICAAGMFTGFTVSFASLKSSGFPAHKPSPVATFTWSVLVIGLITTWSLPLVREYQHSATDSLERGNALSLDAEEISLIGPPVISVPRGWTPITRPSESHLAELRPIPGLDPTKSSLAIAWFRSDDEVSMLAFEENNRSVSAEHLIIVYSSEMSDSPRQADLCDDQYRRSWTKRQESNGVVPLQCGSIRLGNLCHIRFSFRTDDNSELLAYYTVLNSWKLEFVAFTVEGKPPQTMNTLDGFMKNTLINSDG